MDIYKFFSALTNRILGKKELTFHPFPRLPIELRLKIFRHACLNEDRPRIVEAVLFEAGIQKFESKIISWALYEEQYLHIIGRVDLPLLEEKVGTGEVAQAYYTGQYNRTPYVSALLSVNQESRYEVTSKDLWQFRPDYMSRETALVNLSQDYFYFDAEQMYTFATGMAIGYKPVPAWDGMTWPEERMNICRKDIVEISHLFFTFFRYVERVDEFLVVFIRHWLKWFPKVHTITMAVFGKRRFFGHRHDLPGRISTRLLALIELHKAEWISELAAADRKVQLRFCEFTDEQEWRQPGRMKLSKKSPKLWYTLEPDAN